MSIRKLLVAAAALAAVGWIPGDSRARRVAPSNTAALPSTAYRLTNGLRVIVHEDHASPTVVVYVWYHVGSKDEKLGRSGFAHLFEHLMFKGSKHVPDGAFDKLLEKAGGWNNGTTSTDRTNYFEQVPANFLELALYLEADRMAGLWDGMDQKKLDNQRAVVKNERRQSYEEAPYGRAELRTQRALWPKGHGNHHPTIGTMKDLSAASMADVERFYRTYYVPSNATLVIAGDVTVARAKELVAKYFAWMPKRPTPPHVTLKGAVTPRNGEVRLIDRDNVQVAKVAISWRSPTPFKVGDAELELAAQIIAGGKSSRLYRRLVIEEKLASSVDAYQSAEMLGGTFQIEAMAVAGANTERIRTIIDEEVGKLGSMPPTADELTRAQRVIEAELLKGLESLYRRADRLATYDAYTGTTSYFARDLARYRAATATTVANAVSTWLRPKSRVVMVVVPKKAKTPGPGSKTP